MKDKNFKILKLLKISFFSVLCLQIMTAGALAVRPSAALAAPAALQFEPQIKIPNSVFNTASVSVAGDLIGKYIQALYNYGLAIVGILAAIMLMAGGVLWLTSGGDAGKVGQAKELIIGSISGTVILFSSWIILNTVNPALLSFKPITPIVIGEAVLDKSMINNINDAPADTKYGYVCMNSAEQLCEETDPPTINLNLSICNNGQPSNTKPDNCLLGRLRCCGQSATTIQKASVACVGKPDFTDCTINPTANGTCIGEKCISQGTSVCCQCGQGCLAGVCAYVSCKNDVTIGECTSWCNNNWVGAGYTVYPGGSQKYTCAGGAMSYCRTK